MTKQQPLFTSQRSGLLYSLYIAVASISLFVFANASVVLFEAIIWEYTQSYVINAALITLVSFFTAKLLFITAYQMVKKQTRFQLGIIGCFLPIIYPIIIYLGGQQPSSGNYLLMLLIPSLILGVLTMVWWKKIH